MLMDHFIIYLQWCAPLRRWCWMKSGESALKAIEKTIKDICLHVPGSNWHTVHFKIVLSVNVSHFSSVCFLTEMHLVHDKYYGVSYVLTMKYRPQPCPAVRTDCRFVDTSPLIYVLLIREVWVNPVCLWVCVPFSLSLSLLLCPSLFFFPAIAGY